MSDIFPQELRSRCIPCTDNVWLEIQTWRSTYLDMESVTGGKQNLECENERLQQEVRIIYLTFRYYKETYRRMAYYK